MFSRHKTFKFDLKDNENATALSKAAERGHDAVVLQQLNKGADVNAQGGRYGNALQAAGITGRPLKGGGDVAGQERGDECSRWSVWQCTACGIS